MNTPVSEEQRVRIKKLGKLATIEDIARALDLEDCFSYWDDKDGHHAIIQSDMKNQAVQVTRKGDTITAKVFVDFDIDNSLMSSGVDFKNLIISGFKMWNDSYFQNGHKISLNIQVIDKDNTSEKNIKPGQKWLDVEVKKNYDISRVDRGIEPDGTPKSWNVDNTGKMTLVYEEAKTFKVGNDDIGKTFTYIAAHEFGHVLGLDDAYEDLSRNRQEADVNPEIPYYDMMRSGRIIEDKNPITKLYVTDNDLEMVWEAWRTNEWQAFVKYSYTINLISGKPYPIKREKSKVITR